MNTSRPSIAAVLALGLSASPGVGFALASVPPDATPMVPRTTLFGNPERAAVTISPDGTRIAYLAPREGVLNVWVAPVGDLSAAKPITADAHRGIRIYEWLPSGTHVLYMKDSGGDENYRVYSVDVASGKELDLTPFEGARGAIAHLSRDYPDSVAISVNNRDPKHFDVHLVNAITGERRVAFENPRFSSVLVDDAMKVRLVAEPQPDGSTEWLRVVDGADGAKAFEPFASVPYEDALTTAFQGIDRAGKRVLAIDSRGRDTSALFATDIATGASELIHAGTRADIAGAMVNPIDSTVEAVVVNYLRPERTVLSQAVAKDLAYLDTLERGVVSVSSRSFDDTKWIASIRRDDGPVSYYLHDRSTGEATRLFTSDARLEALAREGGSFSPMHGVEIAARDGLVLPSYLTLPPWSDSDGDGRPESALPMVLLVHGGPWARDAWGFNPYHQWLANRGYAVLSVNFRGSTGFGKAFVNKGDGQWADAMHDDLVDAVEWAVANGVARRDRVAIMGGSYGGYAALAGVTFTPDLFAASVAIVAPSNLITLLESVPAYWAPMTEMFAKRVADKRTPEGRRRLRDMSPLTHVDEIKKPLLVGQGANDPRVKRQESDQIVRAMDAKSLPVTYVLFPDEGHGFAKPENNIAFNAVVEAFLAKHIGGRAEPLTDELGKSSAMVVRKGELDIPVEETPWSKVEALDAPVEVPAVSYEGLTEGQRALVDQALAQLAEVPDEALPQVLAQLEAGARMAPEEQRPALHHLIGRVRGKMAGK